MRYEKPTPHRRFIHIEQQLKNTVGMSVHAELLILQQKSNAGIMWGARTMGNRTAAKLRESNDHM